MQMEGKKLGGRYEIVSRVGGGGMAVVYKAKDLLLHRFVAIKVLSESLSNDSEFIRRFSREAQAAASLSHPNIVNVYDVGRDNYTHYIVMELVEGPTLKQYIQERGALPVQEAATIAIQICDGLAHAHENQIVHRDIKPHNILLGANGRAKVTDFGIARAASSSTITQQGSVMGSVHYFSPEQARGGVIGQKSDLYSLGVVMYEMLTGQLPFDGDSAISIALKHLQETPEDPRNYNSQIPDAFAELVMRALNKDPDQRFASAREMMKEIQYTMQIPHHMELEHNWVNQQNNRRKEMYQTIPLTDNDPPVATGGYEEEEYESPVQRPEIRSGQKHRPQPGSKKSLGDRTLANLERLKSVPNEEKTVFQRTVVWLENVQANLPWWQKMLFGLFTIAIIVMLSVWGFTTVWGLFTGDGGEQAGNPTGLVAENFQTLQDLERFIKEHHLEEADVAYVSGELDKIIEQEPKPGEPVNSSTKFKVKVGAGDTTAPNFIGEYESGLRDDRNNPDFKLELWRCPDSDGKSVDHAQIFKQEPAPGTPIKKGSIIKAYSYINTMPECRKAEGNW